jgi:hypothetical protein
MVNAKSLSESENESESEEKTELRNIALALFLALFSYPGRDLNPYTLRHTPLKRACLPVSTPGQGFVYFRQLVCLPITIGIQHPGRGAKVPKNEEITKI